ncbi:hypothetical protein E2C01_048526 [Portunus trituberculatus]|uniref:Uncharacterized protein n=1 Tax=Portunus trituberculatus TaxID=210409 RepID=A0A5B7GBD4_PORTR|nr:hypothetical protein [Portunus trituberculatus]
MAGSRSPACSLLIMESVKSEIMAVGTKGSTTIAVNLRGDDIFDTTLVNFLMTIFHVNDLLLRVTSRAHVTGQADITTRPRDQR